MVSASLTRSLRIKNNFFFVLQGVHLFAVELEFIMLCYAYDLRVRIFLQ